MYKCSNCNHEFDQPKEIHTTYESLYGVGSEFGSRTPCTIEVCPHCGDDEIDEIEEE